MNKNIQISAVTFLLTEYILENFYIETNSEAEEIILKKVKNAFKEKSEKIKRSEAYTKYKTAVSKNEKEVARQEYLDLVGIPKSFRW